MTFSTWILLALVLPSTGLQPRSPVDGLDLSNITSVKCLEARLKDPNADCGKLVEPRRVVIEYSMHHDDHTQTAGDSAVEDIQPVNKNEPEVSFYNYPNFRADACGSQGSHFCDPYGSLNSSESQMIANELVLLSKQHLVTCPDLFLEPINERHLQPFYLGVALAKADRPVDMERSALKQYGHLIMTEWNMDRLYAADSQNTRCPNQALLLILIDRNKAVLSTESAAFIEEDSSKSSAVEEAAEAALKSGDGVSAAVLAAVRKAYTSLENTVPEGQDIPPAYTKVQQASNDNTWLTFMQRALFAFACGALGLSLCVGLLVMCLAPGLAKGKREFK